MFNARPVVNVPYYAFGACKPDQLTSDDSLQEITSHSSVRSSLWTRKDQMSCYAGM